MNTWLIIVVIYTTAKVVMAPDITRLLHSFVEYQVEDSNGYSISTRVHVILKLQNCHGYLNKTDSGFSCVSFGEIP